MQDQRLTWDEIKSLYDQERVELVDYDWPDGAPHPSCGIVRSHSADKKAFYEQCKRNPRPDDVAIVFVGPPKKSDGVVFSPSLARVETDFLVSTEQKCQS